MLEFLAYLGLLLGGVVFFVHIIALIRAKTYLYSFSYDKPVSPDCVGVSIVKTVLLYSPKVVENLESIFCLSYPKFELNICVQDPDSNVIPYVKELMAKYPHVDSKLYSGAKNVGVNPKINNILQCYKDVKYDYVWICDSNINVKENLLHELSSHLRENVGLVHQLPFYTNKLKGYSSSLEKVYFGTHHARWYLFFDSMGILCVNGMSSIFNKKYLDQYGGLHGLSQYLAEDHFMSKTLSDNGHVTVLSTEPCLQNPSNTSFKGYTNRMIRWQILRRTMVLFSVFEPLIECFLSGLIFSLSLNKLYDVSVFTTYVLYVGFCFMSDQLLLRSIEKTQLPPFQEVVVGWLFRELSTYYVFIKSMLSTKIGWHMGTFHISYGGSSKFIPKENDKIY